jgi:hypothetical protein
MMPGHVKRIKHAMAGLPREQAAPPFAPLFTSRDDTSIETDRRCGRIQAGNKVPIRGKPPVRSA